MCGASDFQPYFRILHYSGNEKCKNKVGISLHCMWMRSLSALAEPGIDLVIFVWQKRKIGKEVPCSAQSQHSAASQTFGARHFLCLFNILWGMRSVWQNGEYTSCIIVLSGANVMVKDEQIRTMGNLLPGCIFIFAQPG